MSVPMVTIPEQEYKDLCRRSEKLYALEAGGVDNWEWYDASLEDYYKSEDE